MGKGFFGIIVGMIVTIVVSAVLTFILMNRFNEKEEPEERTGKTEQTTPIDLRIGDVTIQSPVIGEIVPLESISDATFSNEILGKTIAISSIDGTIYAPFDAEVKAVFPTKHAIGLESLATGAEILIHVGLDTVTLDGKGFNLKVKQGDKIEKGQTILTFDKAKIRSNQLNDVVLVVLTNSEQFKSVDKNQRTETINLENDLFSIIR